MSYRIVNATPRMDLTVHLVFEDGIAGIADFGPVVERGGVCTPMRDPAYFVSKMTVAQEGFVLAWPGEVEFCADALRYRVRPEDYRRDYPDLAAE